MKINNVRGRKNILTGKVISNKSDKTISVLVLIQFLTLSIKNTLRSRLFLKRMTKTTKHKLVILLAFLKLVL